MGKTKYRHVQKYCACGKIGFATVNKKTVCLICFRTTKKKVSREVVRKPAYNRYIHSFEWQARRRYKLEKVGYKCEECGFQSRKGLHVHHLDYTNFGNESAKELQVLCKRCHEIIHGQIQ